MQERGQHAALLHKLDHVPWRIHDTKNIKYEQGTLIIATRITARDTNSSTAARNPLLNLKKATYYTKRPWRKSRTETALRVSSEQPIGKTIQAHYAVGCQAGPDRDNPATKELIGILRA